MRSVILLINEYDDDDDDDEFMPRKLCFFQLIFERRPPHSQTLDSVTHRAGACFWNVKQLYTDRLSGMVD